jgi:hypothetical protein
VVAGVGAAYFYGVQRHKTSHIEAPDGELVAVPEAPAVPI